MNAPYYSDELVTLYLGDCLDVLRELPANSVDAVVTDPPYSLAFMSREWDTHATPAAFQQWCELWATECLRVLKPGGHMLAFGGTRTSHRLTCAIEDAGFEIRDSIAWLYGSGFPKSLDVSKAIDKRGGRPDLAVTIAAAIRAARESRGWTTTQADRHFCGGSNWTWFEGRKGECRPPTPETFSRIVSEWPELAEHAASVAEAEREVTQKATRAAVVGATISFDQRSSTERERRDISATAAAQQWQGWGTALKPAHEPIMVARKPLAGTVAATVLAFGTGALNIDGTRIGDESTQRKSTSGDFGMINDDGWSPTLGRVNGSESGRWPANVILDEDQAAALDQQSGELTSGKPSGFRGLNSNASVSYADLAAGSELTGYGDSGGASRFFFVASGDAPSCVLHGMLSVCKSVTGATLKPPTTNTAHDDVQGSPSLPNEDNEDRSPGPVSTAGSSSPATDALTGAIARLNVPTKNAVSLVRSAASAVNLCGSCVTAIVQSAVLTWQGCPDLSPLGLASTHNSSAAILSRSVALVAEDLARYDTTLTTTDLTTSLGCAVDAISTYITRASRHGSRKSDPSSLATPPRMFYTAKADSNERITYDRGEVVGGGRVAHPT